MKRLILSAMSMSVDLRVAQNERLDAIQPTSKTNIHDMIKDSADMIDRLAACLMLSEQTIIRLAKMIDLPEEKINAVLALIDASDSKMLEVYKDLERGNKNE